PLGRCSEGARTASWRGGGSGRRGRAPYWRRPAYSTATCTATGSLSACSIARAPEGAMPRTADQMVVHQPRRLHVGVADRRPHEPETALLQGPAQPVRGRRTARQVGRSHRVVLLWHPGDELPQELGEAAAFPLHREEPLRIVDGALDLQAVADDPRILQQGLEAALLHSRYAIGLEAVEDLPVALPLAQDGDPGEARLRSFEDQELEQALVVAHRHAPLLVVVGDVERIRAAPGASLRRVIAGPGRGSHRL